MFFTEESKQHMSITLKVFAFQCGMFALQCGRKSLNEKQLRVWIAFHLFFHRLLFELARESSPYSQPSG